MLDGARNVLVVAAHPDDEVLGAGGTLARLAAADARVTVLVLTEGCSTQYPGRPDLIRRKAEQARAAARRLGAAEVRLAGLPDMKLDTLPLVRVNAEVERAVVELRPDTLLTHHPSDLNRDHRVAHEATLVAARPTAGTVRCVLAYAIEGVTDSGLGGARFRSDLFVDITRTLAAKIDAFGCYEEELRAYPHARSREAIEAAARRWGVIGGLEAAEPFEVVRCCW